MRPAVLLALCTALAVAKDERLTRKITDQPAGEVVKLLNAHFKIQLRLAEELETKRVTVRFEDATHVQALRKLAAALAQPLHRCGEGTYFLGDDWRGKLLRRLRNERLGDRTKSNSYPDLCARYVFGIARVDICVDPAISWRAPVKLDLRNQTLEEALDTIAAGYKCAWELRFGVVFLSTKERLAALPKRSPLWDASLPDRRVSLGTDRTAVPDVLKSIAEQARIDIRLDARARKLAKLTQITVVAQDLHLANALALALLPAGLTAEFKEGEVRVRAR